MSEERRRRRRVQNADDVQEAAPPSQEQHSEPQHSEPVQMDAPHIPGARRRRCAAPAELPSAEPAEPVSAVPQTQVPPQQSAAPRAQSTAASMRRPRQTAAYSTPSGSGIGYRPARKITRPRKRDQIRSVSEKAFDAACAYGAKAAHRLSLGLKGLARAGAKRYTAARARSHIRAQQPEITAAAKLGHAADRRNAYFEKRRRQQREFVRLVLMAVFAGIAIFSLVMIGRILWRTVRTKSLNASLSERREQLLSQATPEPDTPQIDFSLAQATPEPDAAHDGEAGGPEAPQPTATPEKKPVRTPQADKPTPAPTQAPIVTTTRYHHMGGDALPEMEALYNENRDLIGWLSIEKVIDLPVVYKDNKYYLTHDFYKQKNTSGTLFLDVNHPFKERTQHLLLHGHNMKDGTMFGRLAQYEKDIDYYKWNAFVDFSTLWRQEHYVIFAVLRVSLDVKSEEFFNYFSYPTFRSDETFEAFVRQLQLRSMYSIPIDVEPGDALLTMSTCLDEDRLVIVARRIREGETRQQLRQLAHLAVRQ